MAERGITVDHSTVHRRARKLLPVLKHRADTDKHKILPLGSTHSIFPLHRSVLER